MYKYGITQQEIESYEIFSNASGVVFTFDRIGYIIRFFQGGKKYASFGSGKEMSLWWLQNCKEAEKVVLTEDVLSAIKVSRVTPAVPLLGAHMPLELIRKAAERFSTMYLWLDMDKAKEAVKQALNARARGWDVRVVFSKEDPKELTEEQIRSKIDV